jgi:TRAP-type C4-dicarboxylate transport system permease large subunit
VYFGVIVTVALTTGLVTPPFGLTMFLMCKMADVTIEEFSREAIPFVAVLIGTIVLLIFVPELVLWLPRTLMGDR